MGSGTNIRRRRVDLGQLMMCPEVFERAWGALPLLTAVRALVFLAPLFGKLAPASNWSPRASTTSYWASSALASIAFRASCLSTDQKSCRSRPITTLMDADLRPQRGARVTRQASGSVLHTSAGTQFFRP